MNAPGDFELRHALKGLRQDRAPINDVWPGIEARVSALPVRGHGAAGNRTARYGWAGALAAGIVLAIGLVVAPSLNRTTSHPIPLAGAPNAATDPAETVLAAYADLLTTERTQPVRWADQLTLPGGADRMAAARELDASLAELAAALRIEPHSQLLRRLMHQTLQQRAALTLDALNA